MLILADIRALQDPLHARRGIGSHAALVLEALAEGGARIVGLTDPALPPPSAAVRRACVAIRPGFTEPEPGAPALFLQLSPMTHDTRAPARLLDRPNILPCAVVYDFIPREYPERYLRRRTDLLHYAAAWQWLGAMRLFLPISTSCADDLAAGLGVPRERIAVTGVSLRPAFEALLGGDAAGVPRPAGAPGEYLLFVGGADWRKNVETVAAARARIAERHAAPATLVVAGGYPERQRGRIRAAAGHGAPGREAVLFLDHVDDAELAGWYRHALATVTASRAEGFSLPVIEAMACGSPVLVSDIPAHRELVADPAARFDPDDVDGLAARLETVTASAAERVRIVAGQAEVPRRFTAAAVGRRIRSAVEAAWRRQRGDRPAPRRRPAIAVLSPFPPDRSGVADYTAGMVEALAPHVDVDVYSEQPAALATPAVRRHCALGPAPLLRSDYAAVVAVLGNSRFHGRILDLHTRHGGPCILHDARLTDLYGWWHGPDGLRHRAEAELGRRITRRELAGWTDHPHTLPTLFLGEVVAAAAPLVVHSRALADSIESHYGTRPVHLPFCVQRPFSAAAVAPAARQAIRARLGVPRGRIVVVSLGIVSPLKAPEACIDAIAALVQRGRDVELRFVGRAGRQARALRARAARHGAAGRVHVSDDWVGEAEYRDWLLAADYGIQLRTHRFGGLSGALVDCVAAGLPTVANEDLAAALDAPVTVARVGDELAPESVAAALDAWIASGVDGGRDEAARATYTSEHAFERYAAGLLETLGIAVAGSRAAA